MSYQQVRQLLAFGTVFVFVIFICFYGVSESINAYPAIRSNDRTTQTDSSHGIFDGTRWSHFPDLSRYDPLDALTAQEFPINDPGKRVIAVGDIHGMIKPLQKLLKRVKYDPSNDVLIHVGDIIAKGTHKGSLEVLDFMASNNITGVRGNHDQMVIEWRGWLNWISSLPGGQRWLQRLEKRWEDIQNGEQSLKVKLWMEDEASTARPEDKKLFKSIPKGWALFSDHHKIAKDMTSQNFQYLLDLPLRLYIPSAHVFVVHGGLLPSNPEYPIGDKENQPLARLPALPRTPGRQKSQWEDSAMAIGSNKYHKEIEQLRNLQEISLLTQIPQNMDPWVVLNIRSVLGSKVEKDAKKGKPWPKIWKDHMESCVGYRKEFESKPDDKDDEVNEDNSREYMDKWQLSNSSISNRKTIDLPCYPSTTIYGHAASRGLDIKRWSFGLDSGCVYGRKLTAMVLDGQNINAYDVEYEDNDRMNDRIADDDENDAEADEQELHATKAFGDNLKAKFFSVKC